MKEKIKALWSKATTYVKEAWENNKEEIGPFFRKYGVTMWYGFTVGCADFGLFAIIFFVLMYAVLINVRDYELGIFDE